MGLYNPIGRQWRQKEYVQLLFILSILFYWNLQFVSTTVVLKPTRENFHIVQSAVYYYQDGIKAQKAGEKQKAIELYKQAIEMYPLLAGAYNNMGMIVQDLGDKSKALNILQNGVYRAIEANDTENLAAIHNNIGFILRSDNELSIEKALEAINHFDISLNILPNMAGPLYNKASAYYAIRQYSIAEKILQRVVEIDPLYTSAHIDLGNIYFAQGDTIKALKHMDLALGSTEDVTVILDINNNKGHCLKEAGLLVQALNVHEDSLKRAPNDVQALTNTMTARRTLCMWQGLDNLMDRLMLGIREQLINSAKKASLLPYDSTLLPLSDAFRKKLAVVASKRYEQTHHLDLSRENLRANATNQSNLDVHYILSRKKLKIGYLSFDFRNHPMGHLTIGLLEHHNLIDDTLIHCYSYGPYDDSEWRHRAESACNIFHDVQNTSDFNIAKSISMDEIDIVVDLMGHTKGSRLQITGLRPSPIIVNYLGYPGTMGAAYTDFIMIDRYVVPPEAAAASLTEQIVYLPHSYQVNSYDPEISAMDSRGLKFFQDEKFDVGFPVQHVDHQKMELREGNGLPLYGTVFCNFNTIDKMEPTSFTIWMRILLRVPDSVLWLLSPRELHGNLVMETLYKEAANLGIPKRRIIFAPRLQKHDHLNRITIADIFLDSFIYNAHSTASDALWANLPIVTCWGDTFPSRVAASLISNVLINFPELIASSVKEYEDIAVLLATKPTIRQEFRRLLSVNTLQSPLFDTYRMSTNIMAAYKAMYDISTLQSNEQRCRNGTRKQHQLLVNPAAAQQSGTPSSFQRVLDRVTGRGMEKQKLKQMNEAQSIYTRVLRANSDHANARQLLGSLYYQKKDFDMANHHIQKAIEVNPTMALYHFNQGIVLLGKNTTTEAIQKFLQVLELNSSYTDAFHRLADIYVQSKDYEAYIHLYNRFGQKYFKSNLNDSERETAYLQLSYVFAQVNRIQDAINILSAAVRKHPLLFRARYNLAALLHKAKRYEDGDTHMAQTAIHENSYILGKSQNLTSIKSRPIDRPIAVFYCHEYGQSWWDKWGPSSLNKGLGGSEEAVVFITRELHRLGYHIEVYGNPPVDDDTSKDTSIPKDEIVVHWYPHTLYNAKDLDEHYHASKHPTIFIAWRYHFSLALAPEGFRKYFWIHDVPTAAVAQSKYLYEHCDRIFVLSRFQALQFASFFRNKILLTSNGLDSAYFMNVTTNSPIKFVYASAPNRGLYHVLSVWPRIREAIPAATLSIYYGFTKAFLAWGPKHIDNYDSWKSSIDEMLMQPGINFVGLTDHMTLAKNFASAGFYLYPTEFRETSCISLMKAMANGAIPITSRLPNSALPETVSQFDLGPRALAANSIDRDPTWLDLWVQSIIKAVYNYEHLSEHRKKMIEFARTKYRWNRIAREWVDDFQKVSSSVEVENFMQT